MKDYNQSKANNIKAMIDLAELKERSRVERLRKVRGRPLGGPRGLRGGYILLQDCSGSTLNYVWKGNVCNDIK